MHDLMRSIVVPVDTSELSEAGISVAADLAGALNLPLILLVVVDSTVREGVTQFAEDEGIDIVDAVDLFFDRLIRPLRERGLIVHLERMDGGWRAADGILAFIEQHDIAMIVMSSHGRSGITRWLLGSVAEKVVRSSQIPVVIVPVHGKPEAG